MFIKFLCFSTPLLVLILIVPIFAGASDMRTLSNDAVDTIDLGQQNNLKSNKDMIDTYQQIDNFSGGRDKNAISSKLSGLIGETQSSSLDGSTSFDGQIICEGKTALGTITYTKNSRNKRLIIKLDLEDYGSKSISNISSICSDGVLSKSGSNAYGYSFIFSTTGKLDVTSRSNLSNCEGIDIYSNYSATEDDYDMLTGQVIKFLSSNTSIGAIVSEKETMTENIAVVKLMSQNSTLCGTDTVIGGASSDLYSYTPLDKLYQTNIDGSLAIPDGSSAISDSLSNENSIYYMMNKSLDTEYEDNVSIGSADNNICAIENKILSSTGGFITDGGCSFNKNICTQIIEDKDGYSLCIREAIITDTTSDGDRFNGICGEYNLLVTKRKDSPNFKFTINDGKETNCTDHNEREAHIYNSSEHLNYYARSCTHEPLAIDIKLTTKFKANNELSLNSRNDCVSNDKTCQMISEKVCKSDKKDCIQTVENMKRVRTATIENDVIEIGGKKYTLTANGSKIKVVDELSEVKEFNIDNGLGYAYIERVYACPSNDNDGLKDEKEILGGLLGNYDESYINDKLVPKGCTIPICLVSMQTDDRTVVNNETGETRIDVGNSSSIIKEVRSCEPILDSNKFSCPYDPVKKESIVDQCSCDTDMLMDTIGGTLSGLEVMRQIAEGSQTQCNQTKE